MIPESAAAVQAQTITDQNFQASRQPTLRGAAHDEFAHSPQRLEVNASNPVAASDDHFMLLSA
jgi:hypothetical protein